MIIEPEAQAELLAAAEWYDDQREGLGGELLEAADAALLRVEEAPLSFPSVPLGRRGREAVKPDRCRQSSSAQNSSRVRASLRRARSAPSGARARRVRRHRASRGARTLFLRQLRHQVENGSDARRHAPSVSLKRGGVESSSGPFVVTGSGVGLAVESRPIAAIPSRERVTGLTARHTPHPGARQNEYGSSARMCCSEGQADSVDDKQYNGRSVTTATWGAAPFDRRAHTPRPSTPC
jgi:hypothetical protein